MKRGYADTRRGQLHYATAGTGKPLVLLGPAGRSGRVHARLAPLLAARYRVFAVDMPGSGNSDPLPAGATIELLAEAVVDLLDAVGVSAAHVYGLHTGNKIAAALASRWPERVDSLVLCGQTHSLIPDQARRNDVIRALVHGYFSHEGDTADPAASALAAWAATYRSVTAAWWDDALFGADDAAARIEHAKRLVLDEIEAHGSTAGIYRANFAYDLGAAFARIRSRTLVIEVVTPGEDRAIGRQGAEVAKIIAGARLVTLAEPVDGIVTLENRAGELAAILIEFLG